MLEIIFLIIVRIVAKLYALLQIKLHTPVTKKQAIRNIINADFSIHINSHYLDGIRIDLEDFNRILDRLANVHLDHKQLILQILHYLIARDKINDITEIKYSYKIILFHKNISLLVIQNNLYPANDSSWCKIDISLLEPMFKNYEIIKPITKSARINI